jgi:hypothetical protein
MLKPPVARRIPRLEMVNGDRRQDDYAWLREKDDPAAAARSRMAAPGRTARAPRRPLGYRSPAEWRLQQLTQVA